MKISKCMTDKLIVASPDDGVRQTFFKMKEHDIRHMPVTDGEGKLLGIVSDRDLRRPDWVDEAIDISHYYNLDDSLRVGDIMTTNVMALHTFDSLRKAVRIFLEHKFGCIPVLNKDEQLVGILTPLDALTVLEEIDEKHFPSH